MVWRENKRPGLLESGVRRGCDKRGRWRGFGDQMPGRWKPVGSGLTLRREADVRVTSGKDHPRGPVGSSRDASTGGAQGDHREQGVGGWAFQKTACRMH